MVISIDAEKVFDKIQHCFLTKILSKLGIERNFLNLIKNIYKNSIVNIIHNGEKFETFPIKSGTSKETPSHNSFSTLDWMSLNSNKVGKGSKTYTDWEGRNTTAFI